MDFTAEPYTILQTEPYAHYCACWTDPIAGIQESGDESGDFAAVPKQELEADGDGEEWWSAEDWRRWKKEHKKWWQDHESFSGEDLPWDELQAEEMPVLPDEVLLGWFLAAADGFQSKLQLGTPWDSLTWRSLFVTKKESFWPPIMEEEDIPQRRDPLGL